VRGEELVCGCGPAEEGIGEVEKVFVENFDTRKAGVCCCGELLG
jgi:hypothetical protein